MRESAIQAKIIAYLRGCGFFVLKIPGNVHRGLPDLLAIRDGRAYWFEVKSESGKPTRLQEFTLANLRSYGCFCAVVHSVEEVAAELARISPG